MILRRRLCRPGTARCRLITAAGLISIRETMRQPKLGSSSLHTHVMCVAMSTVRTLQWLESDTGASAECTGARPREPEGIPSMCRRGVHSAREGGVKRRRCITARRLVTVLAAAGLAACAVGPDFKRPASATPAAYRVPEESSVSGFQS